MPNKNKKGNNNNNKGALQIGQKKGGGPKVAGGRKRRSNVSAKALTGDGLYNMIGPMAKMAIRAALPGALQSAGARLFPSAQRISGSGDYVCNDIVHMGGGHPVKGMQGVPVTKYTHSEFIKDILVPTVPANFTTAKLSINAADSATFPWLSRLASLYTKYKFTKLLFEFRTTTSNYSAAGTLGTVVMAPHYNVDALQYSTKQIMEAATHAVSSAPSNSIIMGFECAKKDNNVTWYNIINDSSVARNNFTDPGYVEVATSGLPGVAGTTLGELWVHYTCELIEPYISRDEASAALATQVTRFSQTGSNLQNGMSLGVFGFQWNPLTSSNAGFPDANFKVGLRAQAPPANVDWWIYNGGDAKKVLGFRDAGVYVLEIKTSLSGAPTSCGGPPWEVSAASGSVFVISGNALSANPVNWPNSSPYPKSFGYRWVVQVSGGAELTTTQSVGWTGTSTISCAENDLTIYRIN